MADTGKVIGRVSVKVMPDTKHFRAQTQRELTKIKEQLKDVLVKVEVDKGALNKLKKDLKDWAKGISPLKVTVKPELLTGATTVINARLRNVTRPREVEIVPKINNSALAGVATALAALSGARALHGIFDDLFDKLMNLDKAVPLIGSLTLAIAGIAGAGIAAISNLAALAVTLAQIGPAALTLPGILGGAAIGIGVMVAALKDFKTEMPQVMTSLSALQDKISANFWAAFKAPLTELIGTLMPQFSAGMAATATAMGGLMGSLATALEGSLDGALAGMFTDLNASIEIAKGGTAGFANIITILGQVGAGYLPQLAQWFVDLVNKFSEFLTKAGDATIQGWIDRAIQGFKDLWTIISSVVGIFGGLGKAALGGGAGGLGGLADSLHSLAEGIRSSGVQEMLTQVFGTAHTMISNLVGAAGPELTRFVTSLATTFNQLGPLIGSTLGVALGAIAGALADPAIQQGLTSLVVGMSAAITALAPAMAPLAGVIGLLAQVAGKLLAALGPVAAVLVEALGTALTAILPALMPVVDILGGALLQIVTALSPLLSMLGVVIGQILTALTPILPVLINLVMSILTPLITIVMNIVMAVLPPLISAIQYLVQALTPVLNAVAMFANWLLTLLGPAIEWVATTVLGGFIDIISGIGDIFKGVTDVVMGYWNTFAGLFTGDWGRVWNGIKQVWTGIWELIKGAFKVILNVVFLGEGKAALSAVKAVFTKSWTAIKEVCIALWQLLKGSWDNFLSALKNAPGKALTAVKNLFNDAWTAIKMAAEDVWKTITGVFKNAGKFLFDTGKKIIEGLIDGIKSMFKGVQNTLGNLTDKLTSWKGPESKDRVLLTDAGRLIIDGFIKGLESRYDAVRKSLHGLTRDVANTQFAIPGVAGDVSSRLSAALDGTASEGVVQKVLNYYAAAGNSLGSEEELFQAAGRARMVGW